MTLLIWAGNILGWPIAHITVSFVSLHLPLELFESDNWLTTRRRWEADGRLYETLIGIRKWKPLLPDGAPWLGGFAKKKLSCRSQEYLRQFLRETRRAEIVHWCMFGCLPVFFIWNPPWACCVMAAYAFASNLPCILTQRYNRFVLRRLVENRHRVGK
jgi:glycosyl-4,4'-diaponeurosporenoate acyltransferase